MPSNTSCDLKFSSFPATVKDESPQISSAKERKVIFEVTEEENKLKSH